MVRLPDARPPDRCNPVSIASLSPPSGVFVEITCNPGVPTRELVIMSIPPLDDLDQHLLTLLQANSRTPTATLARQTGAARTTVLARIARLERQGVIAGYGLRLGHALPAAAIRAHLSLAVAPRAGPAVVRAMQRMIEVRRMWAVSGPFDYLAWIECQGTEQLDRTLDRIGSLDGVRRTETSVILGVKIDRGEPEQGAR